MAKFANNRYDLNACSVKGTWVSGFILLLRWRMPLLLQGGRHQSRRCRASGYGDNLTVTLKQQIKNRRPVSIMNTGS